MFCRHRVRGAGRGFAAVSILCLAGSSLIAGCSDFKKSIGIEPSLPDEFAVESRAPLTIPPISTSARRRRAPRGRKKRVRTSRPSS